jgi:hypothetical protein
MLLAEVTLRPSPSDSKRSECPWVVIGNGRAVVDADATDKVVAKNAQIESDGILFALEGRANSDCVWSVDCGPIRISPCRYSEGQQWTEVVNG